MEPTIDLIQCELAFYKNILDHVPACVYINEFCASGKSFVLKNIWCNRFTEQFIGYSRKEIDILGAEFFKRVLHPDDLKMIEYPNLDDQSLGETKQFRLHRLKPKNSNIYFWMYGSTSVIDYFDIGMPRQFLNFAVEISNQIKTENQLVDLLQEANRVKNQLYLKGLTNRQKEIISLIAKGNKDKEIAGQLYISTATAKTHRNMLIKKLNLKNSATLAAFAVECGL
jgi:DNA-binding CsgD family transcriptional regulator